MSIQVLIADDHQLFREGIANLLSSASQIEIVGQAKDGQEAVEKAKLLKPDIVLMDLSLPVLNGVEATRILRQELPQTRILVLSMHADKHYIKEALDAGVSGYLFKDCTFDQLIEAIEMVSHGNKYLSNKITEIIIQDYLNKENKLPETLKELTGRESEILKLLVAGKSTREISGMLFISVKTVGTHKQHIIKKLNLKSTTDLIRYAIKEGIV